MKFDGMLIVTDLDDTLLTDDKSISEENLEAINYFMENGGKFTFITGRTHVGISAVLEKIKPNAPIGCLNGGSIYDYKQEKNIFELELSKSVAKILEVVDNEFPTTGIEVVTHDHNYFCKRNRLTEEHRIFEFLPDYGGDYHEIPGKWAKILLIDEEHIIDKVIPFVSEMEIAKDFDFVRSTKFYYEILPKNASKGNLLKRIADILRIDHSKTIAIGDNENDISMIKEARLGFAVENAVKKAKAAADIITVSNNNHAIAKIINDLDKGIIKL